MKQTTKLVTFIGIPAIIAIILIYDVYAIYQGGTEASISSLIITTAYEMPFANHICGLFEGILIGHLFWRMKGNKDTKRLGLDELEEKK